MLPDDAVKVDSLELVRAEYREMPGMILTKPQVRKLCGLDQPTCDAVLKALVVTGFLKRTSKDLYMRANRDL